MSSHEAKFLMKVTYVKPEDKAPSCGCPTTTYGSHLICGQLASPVNKQTH